MIEDTGDLWEYIPLRTKRVLESRILRCVTTNGVLKSNGALVMGAGVAKQARDRFPGCDHRFGNLVKEYGNRVCILLDLRLASFPTKHHWRDDSDIRLIQSSAEQLYIHMQEMSSWDYVILTRPGCGLGRLSWEVVKPVLERALPSDKFIVVSPEPPQPSVEGHLFNSEDADYCGQCD